jgi:hypothetical protein
MAIFSTGNLLSYWLCRAWLASSLETQMNVLNFLTEADWSAIEQRLGGMVDRAFERHGFKAGQWASPEPRNGLDLRTKTNQQRKVLQHLISSGKGAVQAMNQSTMLDGEHLENAIIAVEKELGL